MDVQIQFNPQKKLPAGVLYRNWSSDSKIYLKVQKIWHNQNNLKTAEQSVSTYLTWLQELP